MTEILRFLDVKLNEVWLSVYHLCNGDEFVLNVTVPLIIMLITYWTSAIFFTLVDMYGKPEWVIKYKIPDPNPTTYPILGWNVLRLIQEWISKFFLTRLTPAKFRHLVFQVLFNQTLVAVPVIWLCYVARRTLGYDNSLRFPKPPQLVFNIAIQILMEEILFYYSHRLLHHPLFYKKYHKRHHEWISPVGVSAIYCHPVEHVLSNVLPTYAGSVVGGIHVTSLWLWLAFATTYGVIVHSGYHLPLTPTPEFHNYHHLKFNENFGVAGLLDWLHGTDKNFRKSQAYARNKVLLTLSPLK